MRIKTLTFIVALLVVSGCTPSTLISQQITPIAPVITGATQPLHTPTPDPNLFTITVEINKEYPQKEIAQTLYIKWLDHFLSGSINTKMRLDEYVINKINIPFDQRCAKKLGGTFIAEAEITAKTILPLVSTTDNERSDWFVAGGGNIIDSYHLNRLFSSVIYQSGNVYRLLVVTQIPMCD